MFEVRRTGKPQLSIVPLIVVRAIRGRTYRTLTSGRSARVLQGAKTHLEPAQVGMHATSAVSYAAAVDSVIKKQRNVIPKWLGGPGPSQEQLDRLLWSAAAAPNCMRSLPWRLVVVPFEKRSLLADAVAAAHLERQPDVKPIELAVVRQDVYRPPLLILAIARVGARRRNPPPFERAIALGGAIESMVIAAQAMGFDSGLTTGFNMSSAALRALFALTKDEQAICFLHIGTMRGRRPRRAVPQPSTFVSIL